MRLPNGDRAVVPMAKLRDYSLDAAHELGKHKARVFAAALGLTKGDAEWLRDRLLEAASRGECELGKITSHGRRYILDFSLVKGDRQARVRSVWNVRPNEEEPRLITCHVL